MSSSTRSIVASRSSEEETIPEQLSDYSLIRVCSSTCDVHSGCDSPGKRPVSKVQDIESVNAVNQWVQNGGNAGVVPTESDDLVLLDIDSEELEEAAHSYLPPTFTIETSSGEHRYYSVPGWQKNHGWGEIGSLRASNWMGVIPPSTHPSGVQYTVSRDIPIAPISPKQILPIVERFGNSPSTKSKNANQPTTSGAIDDLDFILKDDIRSRIESYLRSSNPDHDDRLWLVGWLYNVPDDPNLTAHDITELIMQHAQWNNLDREIVADQVQSVVE